MPDLDLVRSLASQGHTDEKIAETLGIGLSTLYKKKQQFREFRDAIKKGKAEGEVLITSKLYEAAKKGNIVAMIFWLKSRCGWRDSDPPGGVNVNVNAGSTAMEERLRIEETKRIIRKFTVRERLIYLSLIEAVRKREREGNGPETTRGESHEHGL